MLRSNPPAPCRSCCSICCCSAAWDSLSTGVSSCFGKSSPLAPAVSCSTLVALAGSRGSSWHKWPILRLTHLAHGRSCTPSESPKSVLICQTEVVRQAPVQSGLLPGRMSYAVIGARGLESASRIHVLAESKERACCVALGAKGYGGSATKVAHRTPTVDTCCQDDHVSARIGRG